MAEVLFILTTVFVAYVVFVVVECEKRKMDEAKQAAKPVASRPVPPVSKEISAKAESAVKPEPVARTAAAAKPAAPKAAASVAAATPDTLKNPETGEVAKVPNNYRFTKRWIKEALVSEGLLDKIYKNTELDEKTAAKVQAALEKLKTIKKYQ